MTGKIPPSRRLFWLGLLLLLGAGIRLLYLVYPLMDADQAINGLMARHILQGEFPIFFYGQEYCGSIENYLISIVFLLGGSNRFTLGLTIGILSLFLVFFVYCLTLRIADRRTALLAALLTALPSSYFAFTSVLARSAYIEIPLVGVLLLITADRLFLACERRSLFYFLLGFLGGLGLWTHFLAVFYLTPIGLLLLFREKGFWRDPRVLIYLAAGAALGGLPLWVYNFRHPLATWHYLQQTGVHESFGESLKAFFVVRLPELFGLYHSHLNRFYIPFFSAAVYAVLLSGLVCLIWMRRKGLWGLFRPGNRPGSGLDILLLFILVYPFIFAFSGFAANHTTRYLTPLYPAIPILFSWLFFYLKERASFLAWPFLALLLISNILGTFQLAVVFQPKQVQEYKKKELIEQTLLSFLKERAIRTVYVPDYWQAVPLTFKAREEILFAQPYSDRYPLYTQLVDRSRRPAYLLAGEATAFESTLIGSGGFYKKKRIGHLWLFYDFSPPKNQYIEVPATGWRVYPFGSAEPASAAFDRNLVTYWNLGRAMKPGDIFQLDLGRTVPDLGRILLFAGTPEGLPRGLRLEISSDGELWKPVLEIPAYWNSLIWSGPHPFVRSAAGPTELVFPPQPGRYLRITQTGTDTENAWLIAEILVYRAIPTDQDVPPADILQTKDLPVRFPSWRADRLLSSPWIEAQMPFPHRKKDRSLLNYLLLPERVGRELPAYPFPELVAERKQAGRLREALQQLEPGMYREESFEDLIFFYTPKSGDRYRALNPSGWQATSNYNNGEARRAIDGKLQTRWSSGAPQVRGMLFRVDLGRLEKVTRLRIRLGNSYRDYPRGMEVYFSQDGRLWSQAALLNEPLYWDGECLLKYRNPGETDIIFREVQARFIEIRQTETHPIFYWSIHELELFAPFPQGRSTR
jgi:4-amino-4-deoxy-L-arabinose transferase-like glycosyltransferase